MKKSLALLLILLMSIGVLAGCTESEETTGAVVEEEVEGEEEKEVAQTEESVEADTGEVAEANEEAEEVEEVVEEASDDPLAGLADNTSYEIFTAYQAFPIYEEMTLTGTFEEAKDYLLSQGMIELSEPSDDYVGGIKASYGFEDESDAYIEIGKNGDEVFDRLSYVVSYTSSTVNNETGFFPTKVIYNALFAKMKAGEVNNLEDVEAILGQGFIAYKRLKNDSITYTYKWRGNGDAIEIYVDENMELTSYKMGATGLPEE